MKLSKRFSKKSFHKLFELVIKVVTRKRLVALLLSFVSIFIISFLYVVITTYGDPIPKKSIRSQTNDRNNIITEVTELYPVIVQRILVPHTTEEIVAALRTHDHVSIGGGRNSMGGQTASPRAVQIDMREFTKILSFSTSTKEITVQSGIRWRDIQDYIDPYKLSVKIMQTYSNFTVGGSLSVNVHGRYIGLGPIILSVKGFTIVLADGSVVHATPTEHADIFYSAIGGMGGIGVITDVTLSLADNVNVERKPVLLKTDEYAAYFKNTIRNDPKVIFHNGDMYPPEFEHVRAVSWEETDKQQTTADRLIPRKQDYWKERIAWVVMSEWPFGRWIREYGIDPLLYLGDQPVHTRNYEASYDFAELEPKSRDGSSYVLEEYFVPVERFDEWVPKMKKIFNDNDVNVINVSIRHALPDPGSKLAWARKESFAFVVYYKQNSDTISREHVAVWTRQMIDAVISVQGAYYLPYQLHATDEQFHKAYPHATEYFEIKKLYDPQDKFTNMLWDKYYSEEKVKEYSDEKIILDIASTTKEYVRPYDNAYLSIPEWFIVYNSSEYARALTTSAPSSFKYFTSIQTYWNEYNTVVALAKSGGHDNGSYVTVLRVIGVSYSVELAIKGVYENTLGRLFEWSAQGKQVYEEKIMSKMNREYALFIYDYPWYNFQYSNYLIPLWSLSDDTHLTLGQYIRKGERLIFSTLEIIGKSIYSELITFATHQAFGVQDDRVYAVVMTNVGTTTLVGVRGDVSLLSAAHYQPFTRMLLAKMNDAELAGNMFTVLDIAGNKKITLSFVIRGGAVIPQEVRVLMRNQEEFFDGQSHNVTMERIEGEVDVKNLFSVYKQLKKQDVVIDHLYDY